MIHSTAIIDPSAKIADNVSIGPWSIIGPEVEIGEGTSIGPHVVIGGLTKIGKENRIFQFSSIGEEPQDKKFKNERTFLEIGDRNVIREFCTFNRGTSQDNSMTRIGNDNLFMAYVHIAHDCTVGNHNIFANNASLAGHVIVENCAVLSGFTGVFQGCRIGSYSFISGGSLIHKDVPPYVKVALSEIHSKPYGLNTIGLKRLGFSDETSLQLRRAYKIIYRQGLAVKEIVEKLYEMVNECPEIQLLINFINLSERGIIR